MQRDLLFSGENRKRDLTRLRRAYDEIAAVTEAMQLGNNPSKPVHRVVLVHAERGSGKTRLAMELYGILTEQLDPGNYWPDRYSKHGEFVAVMPKAEECNYQAIPPFLWWGLSVSPNPNPGNTLRSNLDDLVPHLFSMRLARRRRDRLRDTASEGSDMAIDLALDLAPELAEIGIEVAGEVVGYGVFKRAAETIYKAARAIAGLNNQPVDPLDEQRTSQTTLSNELLADLDRILNPQSPNCVQIPVVLFIDDAQYADKDVPLASFVAQLLGMSARNHWPILVIVTHWSRELVAHEGPDGTMRPASAISRVINHALGTYSALGLELNQSDHSVLHANHFLEIDLSERITDLTAAVLDQFSGINHETAQFLSDKSSGNPRKLEQVVRKMLRKPKWFQQHDITLDLTEQGKNAVLALSDLPIDEIVLERLCDTPAEVRSALAFASIIGDEFLVELVDQLLRKLQSTTARPGLEAGEQTYRFLKEIQDRSQNDIGRFAEALFCDAAIEYRQNAKADFEDWPDDAVLEDALNGTLRNVVLEPDTYSSLNLEDLSNAFSLATVRLMASEPDLAGLALARTVQTENERGNFEGANAAAIRFIEGMNE